MQNSSVRIQNEGLSDLIEQWDWSVYSQVLVLVDENTRRSCYPRLAQWLPAHQLIEIKSGEVHKNIQTCTLIWEKMTEFRLDRKSLMINLGGGVIGDMGGFCAATYKRGIAFLQMPTTLLAQVDASVGGKLGIDFLDFKNHIGLFQEPEEVWIEVGFLATLPLNELKSGFAEVIKHCLIADQPEWLRLIGARGADWNWVDYFQQPTLFSDKKNALLKALHHLVEHSVSVKSEVVRSDPREKGRRKILNFGHTLGHAVESYLLKDSARRMLHGEAIAWGMVGEAFISQARGALKAADFEQIHRFMAAIYEKPELDRGEINKIIPLTYQDKKNEGNRVLMSLLPEIGRASFNQEVSEEEMREALRQIIE